MRLTQFSKRGTTKASRRAALHRPSAARLRRRRPRSEPPVTRRGRFAAFVLRERRRLAAAHPAARIRQRSVRLVGEGTLAVDSIGILGHRASERSPPPPFGGIERRRDSFLALHLGRAAIKSRRPFDPQTVRPDCNSLCPAAPAVKPSSTPRPALEVPPWPVHFTYFAVTKRCFWPCPASWR